MPDSDLINTVYDFLCQNEEVPLDSSILFIFGGIDEAIPLHAAR